MFCLLCVFGKAVDFIGGVSRCIDLGVIYFPISLGS